MNKETLKVFEFMVNNPKWVNKVKETKVRFPNYKDFYNQAGYLIMEILSTEKEFMDYPRNDINIKKIVDMYF